MEENIRLKLIQHLSETEGRNLDQVISKLCNILETESDGFLKNWIKVNVANAIGSYNTRWFDLCRSNLEKAMEDIENISQDSFTQNKVNSQANQVTQQQLKVALNEIQKNK
ncbi:hypothetical protein NKV53_11315 [Legionella sp. 27cVA30]|uniref:hypothetical protein n=1 Tax=Legionella sp. 27cVA30 TaxID=2905657 RepID=UPI00209E044A|nr:hypothetical protein [Legionella sp. 27cVA30]MCP0914916.1 hypothetical protein [Legionella sp. 27cVA30]